MKEKYILGIGTANVDIYAKSKDKLKPFYDNVSKLKTYPGGVTFNILRNLSLLGCSTKFITATGDDNFSKVIRDTAEEYGIDMSCSLLCEGESSGVFMQIMDENNDMYLAMDDMDVFQNITCEYLDSISDIIKGAQLVVCDPGLSPRTLRHICDYGVPVYIDPTAEGLCGKFRDFAEKFYFIKPNRKELASLTGMSTDTKDEVINACRFLLGKGLGSICVSMGKDGCIYMNKEGKIVEDRLTPDTRMVNASGRGDTFIARLMFSAINSFTEEKSIEYAMAAGKIAVKCESSVNPDLSVELIEKILKNENRL